MQIIDSWTGRIFGYGVGVLDDIPDHLAGWAATSEGQPCGFVALSDRIPPREREAVTARLIADHLANPTPELEITPDGHTSWLTTGLMPAWIGGAR